MVRATHSQPTHRRLMAVQAVTALVLPHGLVIINSEKKEKKNA